MADYWRGSQRKARKRGAVLALIYGLILVGLLIFWLVMDRPEPTEESFGSLDGRFDSDITLDYGDQTLHYRESEITNYLLIGMDREEIGASGYQEGGQADFLLVLSIDRRDRSITPVMIDRDTMTPVMTYGVFGDPAGSRMMQICLAQAFSGVKTSGAENTVCAVSELLHGVKIDRCLLLDLNGIALLNDALGGVEVTLEDDLTVLDPSLKKGATVLLRGDLAEHFVRGRMNVSDGTNAARMRRQQSYIEAMIAKFGEQINEDDEFLSSLYTGLSEHMETDTAKNVLLSEANVYSSYTWRPMKTLPGSHREGADGFTEFWMDEETATRLIAEVWFGN